MFWTFLSGLVRTSVAINRSVAALGAAAIIYVGVRDHLRQRRIEK